MRGTFRHYTEIGKRITINHKGLRNWSVTCGIEKPGLMVCCILEKL